LKIIRKINPFFIVLTLLISGCATDSEKSELPPTFIEAKIVVTGQANPDITGRPSPIVVQIYELKSLGNFEEADFYKLFEDFEGTLGADLVASEKFHLQPGETKAYSNTLSEETNFIAVSAAYRNLNQAIWRDAIAIPAHKSTTVMILLEKLTASIWKK
jgi:type VI secretion system protein VasD